MRRIDLVILDEAHEVLASAERQLSGSGFRPRLSDIGRSLCRAGAKRLFLTATLPISSEHKLMTILAMDESAVVVREPFHMPCHSYGFIHDKGGRSQVDIASRQLRGLKSGQKAILFFRTKFECISASEELGALAYHADIAGKSLILEQWRAQGGALCATSAMIAGVDVSNIVLVMFLGCPYSDADLFQGFGRARAMARVLLIADRQMINEGAIGRFADATCRRQFVDAFFNGGDGTPCSPADNHCDRCIVLAFGEAPVVGSMSAPSTGLRESPASGSRQLVATSQFYQPTTPTPGPSHLATQLQSQSTRPQSVVPVFDSTGQIVAYTAACVPTPGPPPLSPVPHWQGPQISPVPPHASPSNVFSSSFQRSPALQHTPTQPSQFSSSTTGTPAGTHTATGNSSFLPSGSSTSVTAMNASVSSSMGLVESWLTHTFLGGPKFRCVCCLISHGETDNVHVHSKCPHEGAQLVTTREAIHQQNAACKQYFQWTCS